MNSINKTRHCIELRYLQQPFAELRQRMPRSYLKLVESLQNGDELLPVIVVPEQERSWILIDGYLRVRALQKFGVDTVEAEVWSCDVATALLVQMLAAQQRPWEAIEEGRLLNLLHKEYGLSQAKIAKNIGRDVSWVNRRVALVKDLSSKGLRAYSEGKISTWALTRVIQPLARANDKHANQLIDYLCHTKQSTRALEKFLNHYQSSNKKIRHDMIENPDLFFKVVQANEEKQKANNLSAGPEGRWLNGMRVVKETLIFLRSLVTTVFYSGQEKAEQTKLKTSLDQMSETYSEFKKTSKEHIDVIAAKTTNNTDPEGQRSI